jgi:hypothetical protein
LPFAEKLRRKDIDVARLIEEKLQLFADILNVPIEEIEAAAEMTAAAAAMASPTAAAASLQSSTTTTAAAAVAAGTEKDARKVLLAAMAQGT